MQNRFNSDNRKRRMMMICLSFIICHLSFCPVAAQTFTQRVQKEYAGAGKVTIHQDAAIEELVNGKKPVATPPRQNNNEGQAQRRTNNANDNNRQTERNDRQTERTERQETQPERETAANDTAAVQQPRRMRKATGYRIQVFVGGKTRADHNRAEQLGATLRTLFPMHKVYVKFYSPRWTCRMGDFRTIAEAREVYNEVVKMGYDTATIVRGQIYVPY